MVYLGNIHVTGAVAMMGVGRNIITLSGTLSAVSTSGTVTSATRTVTVPGGNSGVMTFSSYIDTGVITTTEYQRNGGAWTAISDGADTVAFSNGDTIAVRTNSVGVGELRQFDVVDKTTGRFIQDNALQSYG